LNIAIMKEEEKAHDFETKARCVPFDTTQVTDVLSLQIQERAMITEILAEYYRITFCFHKRTVLMMNFSLTRTPLADCLYALATVIAMLLVISIRILSTSLNII